MGPLFISPDVHDSLGRNRHAYAVQRNDTFENTSLTQNFSEQEKNNIEVQQHKQNEQIHFEESDIEIFGYMTISEVSKKYGFSPNYLKSQIGIPASTANNSRLGQLRKRYDFSLGDVKKAINNERNH